MKKLNWLSLFFLFLISACHGMVGVDQVHDLCEEINGVETKVRSFQNGFRSAYLKQENIVFGIEDSLLVPAGKDSSFVSEFELLLKEHNDWFEQGKKVLQASIRKIDESKAWVFELRNSGKSKGNLEKEWDQKQDDFEQIQNEMESVMGKEVELVQRFEILQLKGKQFLRN